jgi:hypothetical protein
VVEPFPQVAGAGRKEGGELSGPVALCFSLDLLANVLNIEKSLFRISFKCGDLVVWF